MKSKHECDFCPETCNTISHANYRVCPVCFEKMHSSFKELSALKKDARICAEWLTIPIGAHSSMDEFNMVHFAADRILASTEE